jgi:hypothetical protein
MGSPASVRIARRLLWLATALMPACRREWGQALAAELDYAGSAGERARLVLAAARVALLAPSAVAEFGRAAWRSAALAAIAYLPLGAGLYLSNVVFASPQDSTLAVLTMDLYLLAVLMAAGVLARRASARPGQAVVAGIAAGLVIAVLAMSTFAVIDNMFLSVVSHQQGMIDGFRHSGLRSMRAYIDADLLAGAPGVAVVLTIGGAIFAPAGAVLSERLAARA